MSLPESDRIRGLERLRLSGRPCASTNVTPPPASRGVTFAPRFHRSTRVRDERRITTYSSDAGSPYRTTSVPNAVTRTAPLRRLSHGPACGAASENESCAPRLRAISPAWLTPTTTPRPWVCTNGARTGSPTRRCVATAAASRPRPIRWPSPSTAASTIASAPTAAVATRPREAGMRA